MDDKKYGRSSIWLKSRYRAGAGVVHGNGYSRKLSLGGPNQCGVTSVAHSPSSRQLSPVYQRVALIAQRRDAQAAMIGL